MIDIFPAESDDIALRVELFTRKWNDCRYLTRSPGRLFPLSTFYHLPENALRHATRAHRQAMEEIKEELAARRKVLLENTNCWKSSG